MAKDNGDDKLFNEPQGDFTLTELLRCAERELALRRNVYPKRVEGNHMRAETAARETAMMERIADLLRKQIAAEERATRAAAQGEPSADASLTDVRAYLRVKAEAGTVCPACKQRVEIYTVPFNRSLARNLLAVYVRTVQGGDEWLDLPTLLSGLRLARGNDGAMLVHWGLIESRDGVKARTGIYRLTKAGRDFVEGRAKIRKYIRRYNGRSYKCNDETTISLAEALGEPFDLADLLARTSRGENPFEESASTEGPEVAE